VVGQVFGQSQSFLYTNAQKCGVQQRHLQLVIYDKNEALSYIPIPLTQFNPSPNSANDSTMDYLDDLMDTGIIFCAIAILGLASILHP
jgi:hypothetical protein